MLSKVQLCIHLYLCFNVCVCVCFQPPVVRREAKRSLCTYRVLITANSLEPASSLKGIILNPITYRLRYTTEAHSLSSSDAGDFIVMSPELQRMDSEKRKE